MIHDPELDTAREKVLALFTPEGSLSPMQVIDLLTKEGLSEGIIRSANLSLVNAGLLEITPAFKLRLPNRLTVATAG